MALTILEALQAAKLFMPLRPDYTDTCHEEAQASYDRALDDDSGSRSAEMARLQDVTNQQRGAGLPTYALDPYTVNVQYGASAGMASYSRRSKQEAANDITADEVCEIIKVSTERLKTEIVEHLKAELTAVKDQLHTGRAEGHKELDRVIQLVAAHMWLINCAVKKNLAPGAQQGETAGDGVSRRTRHPGRVNESPRKFSGYRCMLRGGESSRRPA